MSETLPRIVILGVGNTLMADDGLGPALINGLEDGWCWPDHVRLIDGGTQGQLLLPYVMEADRLLVLDAMDTGAEPGTVLALDEIQIDRLWRGAPNGTHDAAVTELLSMAAMLGQRPENVAAVGIQPERLDLCPAILSETVAKAMPAALNAALTVLEEWGVTPTPHQQQPERPAYLAHSKSVPSHFAIRQEATV